MLATIISLKQFVVRCEIHFIDIIPNDSIQNNPLILVNSTLV